MISFKKLGDLGRLGNQLFEIAATISLALDNNDQYMFPPWSYEKYFNLNKCYSNDFINQKTYREPAFHYTPIPYSPNLDLDGFFQSEKYFKNNQDIIQNLLTPKVGFPIKYNHTSIHVRRGDYLNFLQEYVQLDMAYYNRAMQVIDSKYYIVVSDDINWCKANFRGNNIIFSEAQSPIDDLAIQIACEHNIIANSSFSWWGAYLNKNPSKKIIAPAKWFGPNLPHNTKDLIPETWIKI